MKVKLRVYYGKHEPGDTADIKAAEAEHLILTRQATVVEDVEEPKTDEKKTARKSGDSIES